MQISAIDNQNCFHNTVRFWNAIALRHVALLFKLAIALLLVGSYIAMYPLSNMHNSV